MQQIKPPSLHSMRIDTREPRRPTHTRLTLVALALAAAFALGYACRAGVERRRVGGARADTLVAPDADAARVAPFWSFEPARRSGRGRAIPAATPSGGTTSSANASGDQAQVGECRDMQGTAREPGCARSGHALRNCVRSPQCSPGGGARAARIERAMAPGGCQTNCFICPGFVFAA